MREGGTSRRVRTELPVDLGLTFGPLQRGRYDPTATFTRDAWWRAWNTPAGPATTRIRCDAPAGEVDVAAWGDGAGWVLDRAPDWLGQPVVGVDGAAGADEEPFAPTDGVVATLARRLAGMRLCRLGAVFDVVVPTVIEQRVTSLEARRTWARLVRRYGERAPGPCDLRVAPSPARVASISDHDRHAMGLEWRRGSTVARVAVEASRLDRTAALGRDALAHRLTTLRGVGPWTVATVVHFVHGDADAVPIGDWHLPSMVAYALAGEPKADDARMLELLEPFRPHRARVWRLIAAGAPMPPRRAPRARIEDFVARETAASRF
jgi:3-methyladenine DNA glycosylase/8-oxoguanine DNA glycosylase